MNIHVLYLNHLTRQSLEHLFASNESLCMDACDASLCTCAEWMELFPKTNPDIVLVEHAALQQWEIPDKTIHHLNRLHAMILVEQVWTESTADWALRHAFHGMIGCSELTPREFYRLLHMSKLRHQHTTRLQGLRDQSQKMEAVGRMAGGIAHDYNNMLTVIVNNACMARELADDESMIAEELDELIVSTRHAAELTRRLLIMSRNKPVAPQYFSVHAMIQSMQRILKHITGERILLQVTLCDEGSWPISLSWNRSFLIL
ncbi:MAG: hypothetical protein EOL87_02000 [Spartobacteria bacterium]|nr:hypothetical protein [Spartobacteria bacterium]